MQKIRFIFFCLPVAILFFACRKNDSEIQIQNKYESYYELIPGRFIVYDVREIVHDENASLQHDTLYYQLKTLISDTIIDNSGRVARKFIRYKRNDLSQNWMLTDVWTTLIDGNYAYLTEENQSVIKMRFPISSQTKWNANIFNVYPDLECYYDKIHQPLSMNGISFDSTVIVEQEDKRNFLEFKRKFEVYGNRVGLISKYYKDLKINNFDTLDIKSGHELIYTCIDFGIE